MRDRASGRRWLPTAAVLGVMLATTLGGFLTARALSDPVGAAVGVAGVVSVQPLTGWEAAEPGSVASRPFVRLSRGSGSLAAVAWGPSTGDAASLAVEARGDLLDESLEQLTVSETLSPVAFDRGLEGARFTFVGVDRASSTSVEGELTAVVAPGGQGVVFIGLAPEGLLAFVDGDLHTMIAAATLGPGA